MKFKTPDGQVDQERWQKIEEDLRHQGMTAEQIAQVKECDCGCHIDGLVVMC
ncbi:MAG: hypothetical protein KAX55_01550 [Propionivibrio sp.]|nr:hypothetical protein [Propionivibrio sp.]